MLGMLLISLHLLTMIRMLAVMTYNVGYFLSVLAGVFIGSLAVGRYSLVAEH